MLNVKREFFKPVVWIFSLYVRLLMFTSHVGLREVARSPANGLKTAKFNFDLSIFELKYNEVHCHSLKLYPFLSSKIIMVSQNLDYCSRKVTHFLKYPTVTVKIIPSSLKFNSPCRENKAFNYTLIAWKIRSVYQFGVNQKEWNKTNSLQAVEQALLKGRKLIYDAHDASKMATLHAKNREKLPHGIIGRLHNPPFAST